MCIGSRSPDGMKNWLFIGAAEAGQRAAILYTIVQSFSRHGLDPMAYLLLTD